MCVGDPMIEPDEPTLLPGTVIDAFELVRPLGSGTFGAVYEAVWRPQGKRVALKILHAKLAEHREALARLRQEAEAAAEIRHPHIVEMLHVGEYRGVPYLVMELLQGETLADAIKREPPLSVEEVVDVVLPTLSAVAAIHEAGMVHRDLKPANIFVTRDARGRVRPTVLDFGVVKVQRADPGGDITRSNVVLGTPHFMSPEQVKESRNVGPASDQFALGVVLYAALTRQRPFAGSTGEIIGRILQGSFEPPRKHWPEIPPALESVVLRAMAYEPAGRFASLTDMGRALLPFASASTRAIWSHEFAAASASPSTDGGEGDADPLDALAPVRPLSRPRERRDLVALVGMWVTLVAAGLGALHVATRERRIAPTSDATRAAVQLVPARIVPPAPPAAAPAQQPALRAPSSAVQTVEAPAPHVPPPAPPIEQTTRPARAPMRSTPRTPRRPTSSPPRRTPGIQAPVI